MTAVQPVRHGTAEALARLQHFRQLTDPLPDAHELDQVIRFLVGPVHDATQVLEQIGDELDQLYDLVTEDYFLDQLDELTDDDWARHSFATYQQETDHRHAVTVSRLIYAIEGHIVLHRVIHAEHGRTVHPAAVA
jgi:thiamine pyrophosphate-dependent acetolactate synthase large subunit-like protein